MEGAEVETLLKRVGFFREVREVLQEDVSGLPSLQDAVRSTGHPDEARILAYLEEGVCLAACGGVMPDVLAPSPGVMTSPDYLTDGDWLWPGELAHYVAHHHVALPDDFVAHMRENGWVVPGLGRTEVAALWEQVKRRWWRRASDTADA
jgi:hypothetical protein